MKILKEIALYYRYWMGILLFLPFCTVSAQCTAVNVSDSSELVHLYNALGGDNWTDNSGWLVAPVSEWYGIRLTNNGCHVTGISLNGNQLSGNLPNFGNLPFLSSFQVNGNQISGSIPDFSNLPNLAILYLGTNQLSGSIPDFSNLPSLTKIFLGANQFSGSVPDFQNIPNLNYLYLGSNQFSGSIPDFSNLPNLGYLSLNTNQFSGSVPDFSNLPNLGYLMLYNNQLSGSIPDFSNIPNSKHLLLYNNQFSGSIPDFSNIPSLTYLSLYNNQLNGSIPDFSNLPNLAKLQLHTNQLNGSIPDFSNLPNLKDLYLGSNPLSGSIPDFSNLPILEYLSLYNNQLSGSIPDFSNLPILVNLSLGNNQLSGNIPDFSNLPNLVNLSLDTNPLSGSIPDFSNLPILEYLSLHNNQLSGPIPDFSNLSNLSYLALGTNPLNGDILGFSNLPNLYNNQLSGSIPDFSNLPNLSYLALGTNQLSGSIPDFSNIPNLYSLSLNNNQLSEPIPDFSNLPSLGYLYLSTNQLSGTIPSFSNLPNLAILHLDTNQLSGSIPDFSNLPNLYSLQLQANQLTFDGLEENIQDPQTSSMFTDSTYAPQASIPLYENSGILSVAAGGTLANNTYQWFNENNGLVYTATGDSTFTPTVNGTYYSTIDNSIATELTLQSDTFAVTTIGNPCADSLESDSLELVHLYNTLGGDNWTDNSGWLVAPVSEWYGIRLTNNGCHVMEISLNTNQLSGSLPSFGNLPNLSSFQVSGNPLSGSIPNFENLPNLSTLSLGDNQLSGSIPDFANLPNLRRLILNKTQLSGSIPDFSNLPNLGYLSLNTNQLSGSIPDFSNLPNLGYLSLNNNQLSGSVPDFSNLPNLANLILYNNQLSGSIPDFSSLPNLNGLYLYINQLSGGIPDFSSLPNLNDLYLYNNQLSGGIPDFSNLPNLVRLFLHTNQLSGGIPDFSNLPVLVNLILYNNQLSGSIPDFSNIPNLSSLQLQANQLTFNGLEENVQYYQTSSTFTDFIYTPQAFIPLYENNNILSVAAGGTLANNTYRWFDENNGLVYTATGDSTFTPTVNGTYYSTIDNSIATELTLQSDTFAVTTIAPPCTGLEQDSLQLVTFYQALDGDNWINNNGWLTTAPLSQWTGITLTTDECRVLRIQLPNNLLTGNLTDLANLDLPELQELKLNQNQLTGDIPDFAHLPNLVYLYLSNNNLTGTIPNFSNTPNLTHFEARFNQLTGTIPNFSNFSPTAFTLDVGYNYLSGSIPDFANLSSVFNLYLYLDNNKLSGIVPDFSIHQNSLRALDLFDNQLTFDGLAQNVAYFQQEPAFQVFDYAPQDSLPVYENMGVLYVEAGGNTADNTYQWFDENDVLIYTIVGDSTFTPMGSSTYYCQVTNNNIPDLILISVPYAVDLAPTGTGIVDGCDFLCAGNIDYTYGYTVSGYTNAVTYDWVITPSDAATIINGQGTDQISVQYLNPNPSNHQLSIEVTPRNGTAIGTPAIFEVLLDTACVRPGDVDNDGIVRWGKDVTAYSYASSVHDAYRQNNPSYQPPVRDLPCTETGISQTYDWAPHPRLPWDFTYPDPDDGTLINASYADCNGDGFLDHNNTFSYNGTTPLPPNPKDPDVIMRRAYQTNFTHNGNNFTRQPNLHPFIHLHQEDSLLTSGNELRLRVTLGDALTSIPDVHSIGFVVEFELGTYRNPAVIYAHSHLDNPVSLRHTQYPAMTNDDARREWYISMGRETLSGQIFSGQELCRLECIIVIDHVKNEEAFIPIKARILEAGVIHSNGSFQSITGDSTTVYVTSAQTPPTQVRAKGFLGGCLYNATTGLSDNYLRQANLIPAEHPYAAAPWNYTGIEAATDTSEIPANAVDWVLLEVRDAATNAIVEQRAAYLLTDGTIADPLNHGTKAEVNFFNLQEGKSYHLVLRHRNHLDVMSAKSIMVTNNQLAYDFSASTDATLGSHQLEEIDDQVFALKAGDCDGNGVINVRDFNDYQNQTAQIGGYYGSDFTMDGNVLIDDFNCFEENSSAIGVSIIRY